MNIIKINNNLQTSIENLEQSVCAFGSFDGFHLGHQDLLNECLKTNNLKKACFFFTTPFKSFESHTNEVLQTIDDKINFLEKYNFDYIFLLELNETSMQISAERFVEDFIIKKNIKKVVCGEDFSFGYKGLGNTLLLNKYSDYFELKICSLLRYKDEKISTRTIKAHIREGEVDFVKNELGRYYSVSGTVVHGFKNGSKISFPTANLQLAGNYVLPVCGVYATVVFVENKYYLSMTNVGYHPTVDELSSPLVETNIFDFDKIIYDEKVRVYFIKHLRKETKFDSLEKLKENLTQLKDTIVKNYSAILTEFLRGKYE